MSARTKQQRGRDRRDQLLDCAEDLFFTKGYEAASIQDLMQAAGVSKGAVYHHFTSKEEVLEAISVRLAEAAAASVANIASDPSLNAVDKLNCVFQALRSRKAVEWPRFAGSYEGLFAPGNVALFHRINRAMNQVMTPLFARVLAEGVTQGLFRIADPQAVAEMILAVQGAMHPALVEAAASDGGVSGAAGAALVQTRMAQIGIAIDRLLGLSDRTIHFAEASGNSASL